MDVEFGNFLPPTDADHHQHGLVTFASPHQQSMQQQMQDQPPILEPPPLPPPSLADSVHSAASTPPNMQQQQQPSSNTYTVKQETKSSVVSFVDPQSDSDKSSKKDDEKGSTRKSRHRFAEKKRRQRINAAVNQIQSLCNCSKSDKAAILMQAVDELKKAKGMEKQVEKLQEENEQLRQKIVDLGSPRSSGSDDDLDRKASTIMTSINNEGIDYSHIFLTNGMPMCIASLEMKILDMNARFASMVGVTRGEEDAKNLSCMQLSPVSDFHKLFGIMQQLMSGKRHAAQMRKKLRAVDGTELDVLTTLIMVREQGHPKYVLAMVLPVSDFAVTDPPINGMCPDSSSNATTSVPKLQPPQ